MTHEISSSRLLLRLPGTRRTLLRELGALADERGFPLYLVGGVVRDLLLQRKTWDLDVTVEGDGITFARLVADRYGAGLALFRRFATARLVLPGGLKLDIASTRRESYAKPAALPDVTRASLKEDLYRRDFTINAMAIQLNAAHFGQLHDPYGGKGDLKTKTIRVLHERSFLDDPTRIFRAIRFRERFGFHLEPTTSRLLKEAAATSVVKRLSGPRLCNEIFLLMNERKPGRSIESLDRLHLLRFLHSRLRYGKRARRLFTAVPRALVWWKTASPQHPVDRPLLYVMALLSDSTLAVIRSVSRRLQLSSRQSTAVEWAGDRTGQPVKVLTASKDMPPSWVYRLMSGMPDEAIVLVAAKGLVGRKAHLGRRLTRRLSRFVRRDRNVAARLTGNDLKRLGLEPGPQFKTILDRLIDAKLDGYVRTESEERELARRLVQHLPVLRSRG